MALNQEYRQFVRLLEFIEQLGKRHRLESVTLRGPDGSPLGVFTMDNNYVRFGVQLQGRPFIDDRFAEALPSHAAVLRKFHNRTTMTRTDFTITGNISRFQRSVFCALTARALRKLSEHYELNAGAWPEPIFGAPQPRIVNLQFWLIELLLSAGQQQPLLREDAAIQVYMAPLDHVEEKWLFEWQLRGDSLLWPVLTDRQNQRSVDCVAAYGELVQLLIPYLASRRRHQFGEHWQTELVCLGDSVLYLVSTAHYLTLLIYDRSHTGRLVREMEKFIASVAKAGPEEYTAAAESPAPAAFGSRESPSATTNRTLPGFGSGYSSSLSGTTSPAATDEPPPPELPAASGREAYPVQSHPPDFKPGLPVLPSQTPLSYPNSPVVQAEPVEPPPPPEMMGTPASEPQEERPHGAAAAPDLSSTSLPEAAGRESAVEDVAAGAESAANLLAIATTVLSPPSPAGAALDSEANPASAVLAAAPEPLSSGQAAPAAQSPQPSPAPAPAPTASTTLASNASLEAQPQFPAPLLQVRGFTAQIDGRTVLKNLDLALGNRGVFALMGPGGSGKSSLVGILCGRNRVASGWSFTGELTYCGSPLGTATRPAVIEQKLAPPRQPLRSYLLAELEDGAAAAYSNEQLDALLERVRLPRLRGKSNLDKDCRQLALTRTELVLLAIARELAAEPLLLCIDEPTAGMNDEEAGAVLMQLAEEARQRTILFITHNQSHARAVSEYTILLAAGQLQEFRPTAEFFTTPRSKAAQDYVRTGGCYLPSPDSQTEHLSEEFAATKHIVREESEAALPAAPDQAAAVTPQRTAAALVKPPGHARQVQWAQTLAGRQPVLSLREFTLRFSGRPIVLDSSLDIGPVGFYVLVVASGSERRLLLRALCGTRPPTMQHEGQAWYCGQELQPSNQPATPQASAGLLTKSVCSYLTSQLPGRENLSLVEQKNQVAQYLGQAGFAEFSRRLDSEMIDLEPRDRRVLEIVRAVLGGPALLVLDEPLDGLSGEARADVVRLLSNQAEQRAVLVLSASTSALAACSPHCAWLVEGAVLPAEPLAPSSLDPTEAAALPAATSAPTAQPSESLPVDEPPAAPPSVLPPASPPGQGPRGFQWLRPGALAGMPAPGLTNDLSYDLSLIRSTGVAALVTLTMTPLPEEPLREHGIQSLFLPIEDMDAPSCTAAAAICERVAALIAEGIPVGFHCKAGLGRTGTMLAAQLIWEGASADDALTRVRSVESSWVQSAKQISFLSQFQDWLRGRPAQIPDASKQPTQPTG